MSETPKTEFKQIREILLRQMYLLEKVSKYASPAELANISAVMIEIPEILYRLPRQ